MLRRSFLSLALASAVRAQHRVVSLDPLEVETDLAAPTDAFTANEDFFVRNHWDVPEAEEPPGLRMEGLVKQPVTLTTLELSKLARRKIGAVLECAGNFLETSGLVSCGEWEGWSMREILQGAGMNSNATWVHFFGRDGFSRSVPLDRVMKSGFVATHLGGKSLEEKHGKPWRALFPGWYGMDSVKWLERIVLASGPMGNRDGSYRVTRAARSGEVSQEDLPGIQVKSLITWPTKGRTLARGLNVIRGLTWAGESGVSSVAVSADGGQRWISARVEPAAGLVWRHWQADVNFSEPGVVEVVCRATDGNGATQPARRDPARRDGYANNWWHRVRYVVA